MRLKKTVVTVVALAIGGSIGVSTPAAAGEECVESSGYERGVYGQSMETCMDEEDVSQAGTGEREPVDAYDYTYVYLGGGSHGTYGREGVRGRSTEYGDGDEYSWSETSVERGASSYVPIVGRIGWVEVSLRTWDEEFVSADGERTERSWVNLHGDAGGPSGEIADSRVYYYEEDGPDDCERRLDTRAEVGEHDLETSRNGEC